MYIPSGRPGAIAQISGGEQAPFLCGRVKFYETQRGVLVAADICGLPKTQTGIFGFHIHEGTTCTGLNFENTKNHYDPNKTPHPEHAGDLPPLFSCEGKAFLAVLTNRFCLQDVIGRTVVIHSDPDDLQTQPAGNAGRKIACGVICRT